MEGPFGQPQNNNQQSQASVNSNTNNNNMTNFPPPPVFGFSREDSINLEDIFTDWFTDDMKGGQQDLLDNGQQAPAMIAPVPAPGMGGIQHGVAAGYVAAGGGGAYAQQQQRAPPQQQQQQRGAAPYVQIKPMPRGTGGVAQHTVKNGGRGTQQPSGGLDGGDGDFDDYDDDDYDDEGTGTTKKRPRSAGGGGGSGGGGGGRRMTEEQKVERRERNREHAKRSRVRKKFLLESLQKSVNALQEENDKLKNAIRSHLKEGAEPLLKTCEVEPEDSLITSDPSSATKILDDPDYTLVKALQTAQQNFVITDPTLPDNPIVYASGGFLCLTGYQMDQILGRNCRFLQGPDTDPAAVDKIRRAIEEGVDGSVCLLNYRADGSTFWNQFFIAALRGADGNIVNYVGVQCKVSEEYAKEVLRKEAEQPDITQAAAGGAIARAALSGGALKG